MMWTEEAFPVQLNNSNVTKKYQLYGDFDMKVWIHSPDSWAINFKFNYANDEKFDVLCRRKFSTLNPNLKSLRQKNTKNGTTGAMLQLLILTGTTSKTMSTYLLIQT